MALEPMHVTEGTSTSGLGRTPEPDEAAHFDQELSQLGVSDPAGPTRHFTQDLPPGPDQSYRQRNHHITPLNSREAHVLVSGTEPDGSLNLARPQPTLMPRERMDAATQARVFAPDSGAVTPQQGRYLTTLGENSVVGQHEEGTATPYTIADTQRLPLEQVNRVLAQHARQQQAEEAGTAPVRRAATPEDLRPGAEDPGPLTRRSWRHAAAEDGPGSAADQHYKSQLANGTGNTRRTTDLGKQEIGDLSLDGKSGRQIGQQIGMSGEGISSFLKQHQLGPTAAKDKFTPDQKEQLVMRYLFGEAPQRAIAREGIDGKTMDQSRLAKHVKAFNTKLDETYGQGTPARAAAYEAKRQEFLASRGSDQEMEG